MKTLDFYLKASGFNVAAAAFAGRPVTDADRATWTRYLTHGHFVTADGLNWWMAPTRLKRLPMLVESGS
jgi:hypothetical protein